MLSLSEEEFERLYLKLEKPIYNVVFRWVWRADEAQDIVQEAFVRLWNKRARVDATTAQAFVYRIALNLAASSVKRKKLWGWLRLAAVSEPASEAPSVEDSLQGAEREATLRRAIAELPEEQRRVITLCEFSEMSYDEIAGVLGISVGTVGSRRHRALQRLRARLAEGEAEADE